MNNQDKHQIIACEAWGIAISLVTFSFAGTVSSPENLNVLEVPQIYHAENQYNDNTLVNIPSESIMVMDDSLNKSYEKLNKICDLEQDWDGYGAEIIDRNVIAKAKEIIAKLTVQPEIIPTVFGNIAFEYDNEAGDFLSFELDEEKIKMFYCSSEGESTMDFIDEEKMIEAIKDFYKFGI